MSVQIRLRPEAKQDLTDPAALYERQRAGLGQEFLDEALATLLAIADVPLGFAIIHRSARGALLQRFPFVVFFTIDEGEVIVFAVLHGSRDPRLWKSRT